jgi:hypothetical protein
VEVFTAWAFSFLITGAGAGAGIDTVFFYCIDGDYSIPLLKSVYLV